MDTISREDEARAFYATRAGVKGLVDSGITKVPRIFHVHDPNKSLIDDHRTHFDADVQVPTVDLEGCSRAEVVRQIREAGEKWGFFQMVNHGIPADVTDGILEAVKRFHEQPKEMKMGLYIDATCPSPVWYFNNAALSVDRPIGWRDTVAFHFSDGYLDMELVPSVCREAVGNYKKCLVELKEKLSELLSEALGLESDALAKLECMGTPALTGNYHPPCPEPNLTIGSAKHSDPNFLTVLLQDSVGGLQVLHQDKWVDVTPLKGALIVNIGDMIQLVSNDKFKSVEHRVLAHKGPDPRISVGCFFSPGSKNKSSMVYKPIKELLTDEDPAIYDGVTYMEYVAYAVSGGIDGTPALPHFKLPTK